MAGRVDLDDTDSFWRGWIYRSDSADEPITTDVIVNAWFEKRCAVNSELVRVVGQHTEVLGAGTYRWRGRLERVSGSGGAAVEGGTGRPIWVLVEDLGAA